MPPPETPDDFDDAKEPKESQDARVHFDSFEAEEKISVEPDFGDQRRSIYKALPSPPRTPRRVIKKFRFTALLPFASSAVGFALTLMFVIAGREPGLLEPEYMISINASRVGQDLIRFERATSTSTSVIASRTSSSSSSNPLEPLNPLSTASPLNPANPNNPLHQLMDTLEPAIGNITDSINEAAGDSINQLIRALVDGAGVRDKYQLYLEKVCEGDEVIEKCTPYNDLASGLNTITGNIQSSVVIGQTNVSIPLISELSHSLSTVSTGISVLRKIVLAFLIISLIGSGLSIITSIPAIFFPQSRLLVYTNLFHPLLASTFHLGAALTLTAMILGINGLTSGFGDAVGLYIRKGNNALLFVWLGYLFITLPAWYWGGIWFVEVRTWALVRRQRTYSQMGDWKGMKDEVLGDLKGRKDI